MKQTYRCDRLNYKFKQTALNDSSFSSFVNKNMLETNYYYYYYQWRMLYKNFLPSNHFEFSTRVTTILALFRTNFSKSVENVAYVTSTCFSQSKNQSRIS